MNTNLMPCFTDCDDNRLPADEPESEDHRTDMEKRFGWLCDTWAEAQTDDTLEAWQDCRLVIHGAIQALTHCRDRHEDRMALLLFGSVAFEYGLDCIEQDKYEGATHAANA